LISIINNTSSLARSYLTVSDIAVNKIISQTYLDRIQEDKEIDGVYLANSLQQGFIYHYLNQGDIDDAYIVQAIWQYKNRLDLAKLKAAWELAQVKYPTLRLRFSWEEELVRLKVQERQLIRLSTEIRKHLWWI
jgi:adenine-specific DNA methylase